MKVNLDFVAVKRQIGKRGIFHGKPVAACDYSAYAIKKFEEIDRSAWN